MLCQCAHGAIMATYLLHGLGGGVTSVSSSEGWASQPTLDFPGGNNPTKGTNGVDVGPGEYLSFSTFFDNSGADYISAAIWIYKDNRRIEEFVQIGHSFTAAGYATGTGAITVKGMGSGTSTTQLNVNGSDVSGTSIGIQQNEWTLIGFGWGKNESFIKLIRDGGGGVFNNISTPISSWSGSSTDYFVGNKNNNCQSGCSYTIHSIRIYSDELPGVAQDLYNAPYNEWSWQTTCGSGTREGAEVCDDGNYNSGDGCALGCTLETGYSCTGGTASTVDTCSLTCQSTSSPADQTVDCYDNNTVAGDGCSSVCKVESGYTCFWNTGTSESDCTDDCGDGKIITTMPTTYCDDGNTSSNDGCSSTCAIESGWICSGGTTSTADTCSDDCGDGKVMDVQAGYCDDNNNNDGDGCNSTCAVETYWTCTSGSSTTASSCSDICGDGRSMDPVSGYCDDGNTSSSDGCSSACAVETGWTCTLGDSSTTSECSDDCGDGKVMVTSATYCDDGNNIDGDGCSSTCAVESGYTCQGGSSTTSSTCSGCSVNNCAACVTGDQSTCQTCNSGYSLDNGQCSLRSSTTSSTTTSSTTSSSQGVSTSESAASQSAVGAAAAATVVISVLNMSSPTVLWVMANQLQLLLLLVLTNSSMPTKIVEFLTTNRFASFSLDFLPLDKLPGLTLVKGSFIKEQDDSNLSEIGIESGSTFYNNFTLIFLIFLVLLPSHICSMLVPRCKKMPYSESKWKSKIGRLINKGKDILFELFNLTIYLRLFLEAYQFIMLGSVSEIFRLEYTEYVSFLISCVALIFCAFLLYVSYHVYATTMKFYDEEQFYYFKELARGLKDSKEARIYTFFLLLRRFVLVIWLISVKDANKYFAIVFLSVFQLFYFSRIVYSRPLAGKCENIVEITNEVFFTVLACLLLHLNTTDVWEGTNTSVYLYILISNNVVIAMIMLSNLIYDLSCKLKRRCSKTIKTQAKPKAPEVVKKLEEPHNQIKKTKIIDFHDFSKVTSNSMIKTESANWNAGSNIQVYKLPQNHKEIPKSSKRSNLDHRMGQF
ncbi:unnamed protein product [Moneuplotes crassus]|uniref:Uncharacterized protein n=1 Tax=Euplotes crassus TaxID=5936 RepID=A0AAD1Y2K4_EUPCR|nr:unnamed protein product [Moneuplotes crassus]